LSAVKGSAHDLDTHLIPLLHVLVIVGWEAADKLSTNDMIGRGSLQNRKWKLVISLLNKAILVLVWAINSMSLRANQWYFGKISEIALTFHDILEIALVLIKIFTK